MAVAVGLEGDPLGRKVLGLIVSVSVVPASGTTGVVGATEVDVTGTSFSFLPQTSDEVSIGPSALVPLLLSFTVAKNCLVDAIASSLLASGSLNPPGRFPYMALSLYFQQSFRSSLNRSLNISGRASL